MANAVHWRRKQAEGGCSLPPPSDACEQHSRGRGGATAISLLEFLAPVCPGRGGGRVPAGIGRKDLMATVLYMATGIYCIPSSTIIIMTA